MNYIRPDEQKAGNGLKVCRVLWLLARPEIPVH